MHIWCYNIKNFCMKHSKKWGVHSFQIDGQAFTSSYVNFENKGKKYDFNAIKVLVLVWQTQKGDPKPIIDDGVWLSTNCYLQNDYIWQLNNLYVNSLHADGITSISIHFVIHKTGDGN